MLKQLLFAAAGLGLATSALPARADDKVEVKQEARRNADGTVDAKTETTRKMGDATETKTAEQSTSHNLGGGTTTTVEKTHKHSARGQRTMKRHVKDTIKRDAQGHVIERNTKME